MSRLMRALLPLVLIVGLAGCSAQDDVSPTTIKLHVTAEAPAEAVREEVQLGSMVTLEVTSDVDGLLHVHGYEEELPLIAGVISERTFKASMAGVVEIETHEPAAVWIKLVVS